MPKLVRFSRDVSTSEANRLEELLNVMRTQIGEDSTRAAEDFGLEFVDEFKTRLAIQHLFVGSPLFQDGFDRAFAASCEASGLTVELAGPGQRFWDLRVGSRAISLKSTKAKDVKNHQLHISKLTEAAWIQDCRTAKMRKEKTRELFCDYCDRVDEIIQFRYFAKESRYEMVGISTTLLQQILDLPSDVFAADGPSIDIPVGQIPPDFCLKLDRSDAKITLSRILKSKCVVYASWVFPPLVD